MIHHYLESLRIKNVETLEITNVTNIKFNNEKGYIFNNDKLHSEGWLPMLIRFETLPEVVLQDFVERYEYNIDKKSLTNEGFQHIPFGIIQEFLDLGVDVFGLIDKDKAIEVPCPI